MECWVEFKKTEFNSSMRLEYPLLFCVFLALTLLILLSSIFLLAYLGKFALYFSSSGVDVTHLGQFSVYLSN